MLGKLAWLIKTGGLLRARVKRADNRKARRGDERDGAEMGVETEVGGGGWWYGGRGDGVGLGVVDEGGGFR